MDAKEAREQSLKNAARQIEQLRKLISEATGKGDTSFLFYDDLKEGSELWLKQNGYTIIGGGDPVDISW